MHHPVGEPDLVDQVCRTVDRFVSGIIDIVESMKDILDHPVVAVQGKCTLEHNCRPSHQPGASTFRRFSFQRSIFSGG